MSTTTTPPHAQPVRPAIWLVALTAVQLLLMLGSVLVAILLVPVVRTMAGTDFTATLVAISLVGGAIALLNLTVGLAVLVLAILVTVKGQGALRVGGALLIAASVLAVSFSFTTSGDPSMLPDAAVSLAGAVEVLAWVTEALRVLLAIAGMVALLVGIRRVRRQRAAVEGAGSILH